MCLHMMCFNTVNQSKSVQSRSMALMISQQRLVLNKREVDEELYESILYGFSEQNEKQETGSTEIVEGDRKMMDKLMHDLEAKQHGCLLMQNEKMDALAQLQSLKKAIANEHERCGVEAGQVRIMCNAKDRELNELKAMLMEERTCRDNLKIEMRNKEESLAKQVQEANKKESVLRGTVQKLQTKNEQLAKSVKAKEEKSREWMQKVGRDAQKTLQSIRFGLYG